MFAALKSAFVSHPRSVDETYIQHMGFAIRIAGTLFLAALAALVNALFPFIFERTTSRIIAKMHVRTQDRNA